MAALVVPAANAQAQATVSVAYRQAPLARVVTELARATGQRLIFDGRVSGRVNIEGPGVVSTDEAALLLDTLLLMNGLAAVPAPGGARKILQIAGAPSPWAEGGVLANSDSPVTLLLPLQIARAENVLDALKAYLGEHTFGVAYPPSNSLILAGPSSRLRRLRTAVLALDSIERGEEVVWRLQHADSEVARAHLSEILGPRELLLAASDPRTNSLLLRLRPDVVDEARRIVDRLDRRAIGRGSFHVLRLQHADASETAERLRALRDQGGSGEAGTAPLRGGLAGKAFRVAVDEATRSLVVQAAPETYASVFDVVREFDREPPAVRVEVTIASVTLEKSLSMGLDYLIPTLTDPKTPQDLIATVIATPSGGIQALPDAGTGFVANFTRAPLLLPIINPFTGLPDAIPIPRESVSLTLDGREVRTETLMRPQLLLSSGQEHSLFAGDNIPIPIAQTEVGVATQVRQDIQRQDVGIALRLKPTMGVEGGVRLELDLEFSRLGAPLAGDVDVVGPSIQKVELTSVIHLRHGELAVIATNGEPVRVESESGVPWLRDIPWLGFFFRATSEQEARRHLLIAAQASILTPETRALARELARELAEASAANAER